MAATTTLRILVALLFTLSSGLVMAQVYKTVDENGRVSYSDKPLGDNSKEVEIKEGNTMSTKGATPVRVLPPGSNDNDGIPTSYSVQITSPMQGAQVLADQRDVTVQVNTSPQVNSAHRLEVTDNGGILEGPMIVEISRGTHTFLARVYDQNGKVVGESEPVVIEVHRSSLNSPTRKLTPTPH